MTKDGQVYPSTVDTVEQELINASIQARVQAQHWPSATLYVVATPIGNLSDISQRALYALQLADVIACEDTRATQVLLNAYSIHKPLIAAHQHNEAGVADKLIERLAAGQRVALVSDAGAPAVSDPGGKIVAKVHAAGYRVCAIPGPSAVITALMASGFSSDEQPAFAFAGFVPSKKGARQAWLQYWLAQPMAVIMYEAPHRLKDCFKALVALAAEEPTRRIMVGRELTKRFEEIAVLPIVELVNWLSEDPQREKGEFVLVLEAATQAQAKQDYEPLLKELLAHGISVRDSAKILHKTMGVARDEAYQAALALKDK
ncbi:16S rRNA (cytidine(1402)-2'-O)-methyltransferase [Oligella urethralis]|uniref:16S rRNA (cytidine(1402)-2'-O)-methyltransferase n=1 Tax=Oligella urethralis TaxID=90245 RepID=UPI0009E2BEF0|nr:16S rRNA (cytidine(1402)-2'-O)-methyltransferase [Oligella urethralis]